MLFPVELAIFAQAFFGDRLLCWLGKAAARKNLEG
jgi:hypothetical protein